MIHKIRHLLGKRTTRPIFVIGTGRSGTHWLAKSLQSHRAIRATIEKKPMFRWVTQMALDASTEQQLLPKLISAYRWQMFLSTPRLYLDKSHPNIWLAEHLQAAFPDALFIGIERNPFATVASMLRHRGVALWHQRWRDFPVPNRFLGISEKLAQHYDELPLAVQCAHRWLAHHQRLAQLQREMPHSVHVIQYETLATDSVETMRHLQAFLKLDTPIASPTVATDSLHKWKSYLTSQQIDQIWQVVGCLETEQLQRAA